MRDRYAIDARWIPREPSGIGVYARELVTRIPPLAPETDFVVYFCDPGVRDDLFGPRGERAPPNVTAALVPWGVHSVAGQWGLARDLRRREVDLYHSPAYMFPLPAFPVRRSRQARLVVTLHDVVPLVSPEAVRGSRKRRLLPLYRLLHREAVRRADGVLCVSDSARREIVDVLGVPDSRRARFHTVHNGVSDRHLSAGAAASRAPHGRVPTVLYVGRSDPYKNLANLVRAFATVRRRFDGDVRLRIVGSPDPRYPEPMQIARELGVEPSVDWAGYLRDDALLDAYRSAAVLAHPSRHEGFGLPVLEAMACGLPVVCSDRSALPEVCGGAALLTDPDDSDALAAALLRVLRDPELAADLSRRGRTRAASFTWDRAALGTLAVYRSVARGGGADDAPASPGPLRENSERS